MISGASEEELDIAIDRADLLLEIEKYKNIINKLKEAIKLDLSFAEAALKLETNEDSINNLITYDKNLLKIIDDVSV